MSRTWCLLCAVLVVGASGVAACSSDATRSSGTTTTLAGGATTTSGVNDATTTVATDAETPTTGAGATPAFTGPSEAARTVPTAWVAGPQIGDPVATAAAGDCQPFYDALASGPYSQSRCGVWNASDGQRTWTVTRGLLGFLVGIIWQQTSPNNWVPVMRAIETTPGQWDDITVITGNTDSGPNDEFVSGTRIAGASGKLAIALIDIRSGNPGVVAVVPTGNQGVAVLRPGTGVEVWSGVESDADPKCCPTSFTHTLLAFVGGTWVIQSADNVPAGDPSIPESEF